MLKEVFNTCRKHNIFLNLNKYYFGYFEIAFFGHQIGLYDIKPNQNRILAIDNLSEPKNITELKSFLEMTGYYRKFMKNYSHYALPLNKLLKKGVKYE